jgi:hypothetical protein
MEAATLLGYGKVLPAIGVIALVDPIISLDADITAT